LNGEKRVGYKLFVGDVDLWKRHPLFRTKPYQER
jgi:hypothetical protein